jgi:phospholipid transport system substrate-binding protein
MTVDPIRRRTLFRLAIAGVMASGGLATTARAQSAGAPAAPIDRLNAALIAAMKLGRSAPFSQRFETLAARVNEAFDLDAVLRTSVGPNWVSLSADEQHQLQTAFARYTIANYYVANFDSYAGETFQVAPETRAIRKETTMSPLRERMIEDMTLAGLALGTRQAYTQALRCLAAC